MTFKKSMHIVNHIVEVLETFAANDPEMAEPIQHMIDYLKDEGAPWFQEENYD